MEFDPTSIHKKIADEISQLPVKETPVSADKIVGEDSQNDNEKVSIAIGSLPTGQGGEANTAMNVGSSGVGFYLEKVGVELDFKNLTTNSPAINISENIADKTVAIDLVPSLISIDDIGDGIEFKKYELPERTKLAGIEPLADVTDIENVTIVLGSININAMQDIISSGVVIENAVGLRHIQGTDTTLGPVSNHIDLNEHRIFNAAAPVDDHDLANKEFVLSHGGGENLVHLNVPDEIAQVPVGEDPMGSYILLAETTGPDPENPTYEKKRIAVADIPGGGPGSDTTAYHFNGVGEYMAIVNEKEHIADYDVLSMEDSEAAEPYSKIRVRYENLMRPRGGIDVTAFHSTGKTEYAGIPRKMIPEDDDILPIEDSADEWSKKHIRVCDITGGGTHDPKAVHIDIPNEFLPIPEKLIGHLEDEAIIESYDGGSGLRPKFKLKLRNFPAPEGGTAIHWDGIDEYANTPETVTPDSNAVTLLENPAGDKIHCKIADLPTASGQITGAVNLPWLNPWPNFSTAADFYAGREGNTLQFRKIAAVGNSIKVFTENDDYWGNVVRIKFYPEVVSVGRFAWTEEAQTVEEAQKHHWNIGYNKAGEAKTIAVAAAATAGGAVAGVVANRASIIGLQLGATAAGISRANLGRTIAANAINIGANHDSIVGNSNRIANNEQDIHTTSQHLHGLQAALNRMWMHDSITDGLQNKGAQEEDVLNLVRRIPYPRHPDYCYIPGIIDSDHIKYEEHNPNSLTNNVIEFKLTGLLPALTAPLDMGANRITNLAHSVDDTDAVRKGEAATNPMDRELDMNEHRITNLKIDQANDNYAATVWGIKNLPFQRKDWYVNSNPLVLNYQIKSIKAGTDDHDAVNKQQMDAVIAEFVTNPMTVNLDMGENKIVNLAEGVAPQDAVRVKDTLVRDQAHNAVASYEGQPKKIVGLLSGVIESDAVNAGQTAIRDAAHNIDIKGLTGANRKITNLLQGDYEHDGVNVSQTAIRDVNLNLDVKGLTEDYRKIINLDEGTEPYDAVNVSQTAIRDDNLNLDAMGSTGENRKIINLAAGTDDHDGVNKQQMDALIVGFVTNPMTVNLDMGENKIVNLAEGLGPKDAVRVKDTMVRNILRNTEASYEGEPKKIINLLYGVDLHDAVNVYQTAIRDVNFNLDARGLTGTYRKIINLAAGTDDHDGVNKQQMDALIVGFVTNPMTVNLNMGRNKIVNMARGVDDQDAVNVLQTAIRDATGNIDIKGATGVNRKIINLAAGTDGHDGVNVLQTAIRDFNLDLDVKGRTGYNRKITNLLQGTAIHDGVNVFQTAIRDVYFNLDAMGGTGEYRKIINLLHGVDLHDAVNVYQTAIRDVDFNLDVKGLTENYRRIINIADGIDNRDGVSVYQTAIRDDNLNLDAMGSTGENRKIINLADSIDLNDAVNRQQILELPLQSIDWNIGFGGNYRKIQGLKDGIANHDAVNVLQTAIRDATGNIDIKGATGVNRKIKNLAPGTDGHDGVNVYQTAIRDVNGHIDIKGATGENKQIKNLAAGSSSHSAVNKQQIETALKQLPFQTKNFVFNQQNKDRLKTDYAYRITQLGSGVDDDDAVIMKQLTAAVSGMLTNPMTADLDMGAHKIMTVMAGSFPSDGVNYSQIQNLPIQQVDWEIGSSTNLNKIKYLEAGSSEYDGINFHQLSNIPVQDSDLYLGLESESDPKRRIRWLEEGQTDSDAVNKLQMENALDALQTEIELDLKNLPPQDADWEVGVSGNYKRIRAMASGITNNDAVNVEQLGVLPEQTNHWIFSDHVSGLKIIKQVAEGVDFWDVATVGQLTLLKNKINEVEAKLNLLEKE